jgi:hypothetical protein
MSRAFDLRDTAGTPFQELVLGQWAATLVDQEDVASNAILAPNTFDGTPRLLEPIQDKDDNISLHGDTSC